VVWGNCGYSAVGDRGAVSHQIAALGWGFGSTMGTVVYHGLLVIFTDGYGPRTIPDNGPMFQLHLLGGRAALREARVSSGSPSLDT